MYVQYTHQMGAESIAFIILMVVGGLLLMILAGCRARHRRQTTA